MRPERRGAIESLANRGIIPGSISPYRQHTMSAATEAERVVRAFTRQHERLGVRITTMRTKRRRLKAEQLTAVSRAERHRLRLKILELKSQRAVLEIVRGTATQKLAARLIENTRRRTATSRETRRREAQDVGD